MTNFRCCICAFFTMCGVSVYAANLYRYQESNGRWVFSDKQSVPIKGNENLAIEKITIEDHRVKQVKPSMEIEETYKEGKLNQRRWLLSNPLPVVVQHWLAIKGQVGFVKSMLSQPFENVVVTHEDAAVPVRAELKHFYLLGEPIEKPAIEVIEPPYANGKHFRISQGFNGRFSHSQIGNRYALDIAMPIGEPILAIKEGIIADAQDRFSIGGAANYFLDKANHVTVMHDDGSYAVYAHLLYGSLDVVVGQRIVAGQVLARIGSTGYSTGPHLHFVWRYNSGRGVYSIPFKFKTAEGDDFPEVGRYYTGTLKKIE